MYGLLTAAELRAVLDLVGAMHEAADAAQVSAVLMARLAGVIPLDLISNNDIDTTGTGTSYTTFEPALADHEVIERAFAACQHEHPLIRDMVLTGDPRPRRMSDFVALPRLRATDLWREVFSPLETNYQVGFATAVGPGRVLGIGLNRATRDFTDHEMVLAELVRQHLPAAYHHARLRAQFEPNAQPDSRMTTLSPREMEILALMSTGRSNREIAVRLFIAARTVDKHVANLFRKLGVHNRVEAVLEYIDHRKTSAASSAERVTYQLHGPGTSSVS